MSRAGVAAVVVAGAAAFGAAYALASESDEPAAAPGAVRPIEAPAATVGAPGAPADRLPDFIAPPTREPDDQPVAPPPPPVTQPPVTPPPPPADDGIIEG